MSIFKELTEELSINGHTIPVQVTIEVDEDIYVDPADDFNFGDEATNAEYLERFRSGELFMGSITVTAKALGEVGSDHLGACHLCSNNAFNSAPFNTSVNNIVDDYQMVNRALLDLREMIISKAKLLKEYAT
jgi:hypothetical protein